MAQNPADSPKAPNFKKFSPGVLNGLLFEIVDCFFVGHECEQNVKTRPYSIELCFLSHHLVENSDYYHEVIGKGGVKFTQFLGKFNYYFNVYPSGPQFKPSVSLTPRAILALELWRRLYNSGNPIQLKLDELENKDDCIALFSNFESYFKNENGVLSLGPRMADLERRFPGELMRLKIPMPTLKYLREYFEVKKGEKLPAEPTPAPQPPVVQLESKQEEKPPEPLKVILIYEKLRRVVLVPDPNYTFRQLLLDFYPPQAPPSLECQTLNEETWDPNSKVQPSILLFKKRYQQANEVVFVSTKW